MADDPTRAYDPARDVVAFRLGRLEAQQQDLAARSISPDLYGRDRAELERRISGLETDLEQERQARRAAERDAQDRIDRMERHFKEELEKAQKAINDRLDKSGSNWRQSLFQGVLPVMVAILTLAVTVWLATRSTGK